MTDEIEITDNLADRWEKWEFHPDPDVHGARWENDDFLITVQGRSYADEGSTDVWSTHMYVHTGDFDLAENWENRCRRPYTLYRKFINEKVWPALGVTAPTLRWSQKCGCTMCPCSPGFIIKTPGHAYGHRTGPGCVPSKRGADEGGFPTYIRTYSWFADELVEGSMGKTVTPEGRWYPPENTWSYWGDIWLTIKAADFLDYDGAKPARSAMALI